MERFTVNLREVGRSVTPRSIARHAFLSGSQFLNQFRPSTAKALAQPRIQFLYLHHVFQDEEQSFRELLQNLSLDHTFIGYSEAVTRAQRGPIDKPYIALSFDDGFKNCVRAAEIMDEFGAKGCFFLCTAMIGEKDFAKVKQFCEERLHLPPVEFMEWDDVHEMKARGHEFGSHTRMHVDLGKVSESEAVEEIEGSAAKLRAELGGVSHFAWPYGRFKNFSRFAHEKIRERGFQTIASAERGAHATPGGDDVCIRRDHVLAAWPVSHIRYFIIENSRSAGPQDNEWPTNLATRASG